MTTETATIAGAVGDLGTAASRSSESHAAVRERFRTAARRPYLTGLLPAEVTWTVGWGLSVIVLSPIAMSVWAPSASA